MLEDVDPLTKNIHVPEGYHDNVSTIGDNMVINGTFDTDTDWDKTGDAIISGGVATFVDDLAGRTGTWSPTVALNIEIGKQYQITLDATLSNANLDITIGGYTSPTLNATGSFSLLFTATTTADLVLDGEIVSGKSRVFNFDNVEVKPVGTLEGNFELISATLYGTLNLNSDNIIDIGSDGLGIKRIFLGEPSASTSLPDFTGLTCSYATGDMYFGNDNVYVGYYVQKTVVSGSTASDNSDDYTNLYQGDANYQKISLMYDIEYNATEKNGVEIGGATTNSPPLYFGGDNKFLMRFDGTNNIFIMTGQDDIPIIEVGLNHLTVQECIRPDTDDKIDLGDIANTLRWRRGYFSDLVEAVNQFNVNGTKVVGSQQAAISNAETAHDLNATFSDTEVEGALDDLGTKINSILAILRTHGLIAT